ncbi:nicotinate-nucleotide--dimethylbenzimidazole phosphoribosyltransferase [Actibacterium sp. 188UL27-1]|uniref:nicotinate-nucleotide--dimethylbenzimidazole phosphoribosyltransferase n=1 Tax=Actibacterium sp. 188UL27-1 TaxID=2786961 RepID=UPI001957FA37|nr:nicotinate-nucleotide--dimethylbenzimidazole phosphoribosyltransferase [Actibacterium sp. 188UL27-1]MBM7066599.1 nicotinate-nucleotide--dimethylbenzimidazole phosphoribosyltransferase [Actibacterium sp. 188UL27-1]
MTAPFTTLADMRRILADLPGPDAAARRAATARNGQLTKPPGALGCLEDLAFWYAEWRGEAHPVMAAPQIIVFAGNHGVTAQGVSAFPAEVTAQMVANFAAGGAAINQVAKLFGATLDVVPLDLTRPTADFTSGPAMTEDEVIAALNAGWQAIDLKSDLLVVGEMGIGNTTAAAALAAAAFGGAGADWAGRGTGVDDAGLGRKAAAIDAGLAANPAAKNDPLQALRCLGGRELAAMAGAVLAARQHGIPVILDGFICTAAVAMLEAARPGALDHCVAGHLSAEGAHAELLARIGKEPLLSLGLRLGEGSGAAVAIGILQAALACHSGMATFAEAGVADG